MGPCGDGSLSRPGTDNDDVFITPGCSERNVASNTISTTAPARPTSVDQYRSSGANYSGEPMPRASASALGTGHSVGTSTIAPVVPSPITEWAERISGRDVVKPRPTFALTRSSREAARESVRVPSALISLGIDNMLDIADAF